MSRVGKIPIKIPAGVTVELKGDLIKVSKDGRYLERKIHPELKVEVDHSNGLIKVLRDKDSKFHRSLHGLFRSLINNMVVGVTQGFEKKLEIVGIGYRAELKGKNLALQLGFSHSIVFVPPQEIELVVENPNTIVVKGMDKELVGLVAAKIRSFKPPEPYKGKGIKYAGEIIRRKAGKAAS